MLLGFFPLNMEHLTNLHVILVHGHANLCSVPILVDVLLK